MVAGNKNKRGQKKEKEGRGFGRLPSFFFPSFLFVFSRFFSSGDFDLPSERKDSFLRVTRVVSEVPDLTNR